MNTLRVKTPKVDRTRALGLTQGETRNFRISRLSQNLFTSRAHSVENKVEAIADSMADTRRLEPGITIAFGPFERRLWESSPQIKYMS